MLNPTCSHWYYGQSLRNRGSASLCAEILPSAPRKPTTYLKITIAHILINILYAIAELGWQPQSHILLHPYAFLSLFSTTLA